MFEDIGELIAAGFLAFVIVVCGVFLAHDILLAIARGFY